MPVLRIGPYASTTDYSLNQPASATLNVLPVNCAMGNWENDSWKSFVSKSSAPVDFYQTNLPQSHSYTDSDVDASGLIRVAFAYQASVATTMNIVASATATALTTGLTFSQIRIDVGAATPVNQIDDNANTTSESFSGDVSLPKAITPTRVVILVQSGKFGSGSGDTINITGSLSIQAQYLTLYDIITLWLYSIIQKTNRIN